MSDFIFRLLSRSTSSSEDIVSSEHSSLSKEAFDKFATSTVVPTKGPLEYALLLLCARGVRLFVLQSFLRFLCGTENGLEDFKPYSESARLRTSPLSKLFTFVGVWVCETVQQGSYLSSRTAFVPFLDIPLEVNRSICLTEGIDSGIENDAKIIGDDDVVSRVICLLFFGVKGNAESEWGSMLVFLSLVWWLIASSDTSSTTACKFSYFSARDSW